MFTNGSGGAGAIINLASGTLNRLIFSDPAIYGVEQKRIFARGWMYVGHESQVRNSGEYILSKMGSEPVIVTRDRTGKINVFLNSCRHRGMRVCRYDEGKTDRFYCPYHGWGYGLDGSLKHVNQESTEYGADFNKADWALYSAPQVATLHGTIWATWDADAPSFEDYLGDAYRMLDMSFRGWDGEGEIEVLGSVQKWIVPSNWKIVAENFAGDSLHAVSHASVDRVGINPNGTKGRRDVFGKKIVASYPLGHGGIYFDYSDFDRSEYLLSEETAQYFQKTAARRREVMGEDARLSFGVGTIFPNMSFHGTQPRTILVAHPIDENRTEMWRWYFVDKDAPTDVKRFLRRYYLSYSGPGGLTEQDDMENWKYATAASRGLHAAILPYNYQAGMRHGIDERVPGAKISMTSSSEQNARGLYASWKTFMETDDWAEIMK